MPASGKNQKAHLECHLLTQDFDLLLLPLLLLQFLLAALPLHDSNAESKHGDGQCTSQVLEQAAQAPATVCHVSRNTKSTGLP